MEDCIRIKLQILTGRRGFRDQPVAKLLGLSGKTPSRAKLMSAARHINWTNPFMIPGVKEKTTPSDPFPLSQVKLIRFQDGRWNEFGSLINGRSGT